jgi:hypothetical protein
MKKIYLSLLFIFCAIQLKAQSFEVSVQANTGLSHYSGTGTLSSTFLNADDQTHTGYPNGDGNRNAAIFGADIQWQYISRHNFILGLQTGYEALGSKVDITSIGSPGTPATGSFTDHLNYINLNPYVGYRFKLSKVRLDVMPGLDFALGIHGSQGGKATTNNNVTYTASDNINGTTKSDVRLRLGLAAYYQKFGITASYSHGLANFNSGALSDSVLPTLRVEVLRIGLSYRIK